MGWLLKEKSYLVFNQSIKIRTGGSFYKCIKFSRTLKITRHTKKKAGKYGTKEQSKSLIINSKEKEIYELRDKEFKTTILKKLNDLKRKQLNQIRKMMHEQIENINKKIKTILKILEEKIQ